MCVCSVSHHGVCKSQTYSCRTSNWSSPPLSPPPPPPQIADSLCGNVLVWGKMLPCHSFKCCRLKCKCARFIRESADEVIIISPYPFLTPGWVWSSISISCSCSLVPPCPWPSPMMIQAWCQTGTLGYFDRASKFQSSHESSGGQRSVRMLTLCTDPALQPRDIFLSLATHGKEALLSKPPYKPQLCDV